MPEKSLTPCPDHPQPDSPISNNDLFKLWLVEELKSETPAKEVLGALCDVLGHVLPPELTVTSARRLAREIKDRFDRGRDRALLVNTQEADIRLRQRLDEAREEFLATGRRAAERSLLQKIGRACQTQFSSVEEAEKRLPELTRGDQQPETVWEDRIMYVVVGSIHTYGSYESFWVVASYTSEDDAKAHAERANEKAQEIDQVLNSPDYVEDGASIVNEHDPNHAVGHDRATYEIQEAPFRMAKQEIESQTSMWDQLTREF